MVFGISKKKEKSGKAYSDKMIKRVSGLSSPELTTWFDQALSETGRVLYAYDKTKAFEDLEDLAKGVEAINALYSELAYRATTR
jgi:aspartyl aminopeptidase